MRIRSSLSEEIPKVAPRRVQRRRCMSYAEEHLSRLGVRNRGRFLELLLKGRHVRVLLQDLAQRMDAQSDGGGGELDPRVPAAREDLIAAGVTARVSVFKSMGPLGPDFFRS